MIAAVIQARMGGSRLPGKVMADIAGRPMLAHIIERVKHCSRIDNIVIATTGLLQDKGILAYADSHDISAYAGKQDDVLDRYYHAAKSESADIIVRITADDPLKDPEIIDLALDHMQSTPGLDYVSNTIEPTYPEGLDIEVFTFQALESAHNKAVLASEREHVTPYIWKNPFRFKVMNFTHHKDLSFMRWTVDYEEDLRFIRKIYDRLYRGKIFLMQEILDLLEQEPELMEINKGIDRNQGYARSILAD